MAKIMASEPGMTVYDPCCGSAGLLIKCEIAMKVKLGDGHSKPSKKKGLKNTRPIPLKLFGQEYIANTWPWPT